MIKDQVSDYINNQNNDKREPVNYKEITETFDPELLEEFKRIIDKYTPTPEQQEKINQALKEFNEFIQKKAEEYAKQNGEEPGMTEEQGRQR